jgi:competence protein ComFC
VEGRSNARGRLSAWVRDAGDALVSVVFPADCRLCERLLTRASRVPICDACLDSFELLEPPLCEICGQPIELPSFGTQADSRQTRLISGFICSVCEARTYSFDRAWSWAKYEAALVRAIVLLKFSQIEPLGAWFGDRLLEVWQRRSQEGEHIDIVVPVPLHRQRERERGYNQADLIARPLAKKLRLPYRPVLLVRKKPRPDKQILSLEERWSSVRGAFATRPGSQVDKLRVLLVDDVMTTGATLDACARALREAGAKSVIGLTVARAARHPVLGSEALNQPDPG